MDTATEGRRGTGKLKGFRALIIIDMDKEVPDYLMRMIEYYLRDRWDIYEGDKWSHEEEITSFFENLLIFLHPQWRCCDAANYKLFLELKKCTQLGFMIIIIIKPRKSRHVLEQLLSFIIFFYLCGSIIINIVKKIS